MSLILVNWLLYCLHTKRETTPSFFLPRLSFLNNYYNFSLNYAFKYWGPNIKAKFKFKSQPQRLSRSRETQIPLSRESQVLLSREA